MKYIKYFEQDSDYQQFVKGNEFLLPNVSYVEDVNNVYYNPMLPISMNEYSYTVKFDYDNTYMPLINSDIMNISQIEEMRMNGEVINPVSSMTFTTAGEYTFVIKLNEKLTNANSFFLSDNYKSIYFKEINMGNFNTSNVTDMGHMFHYCTGLTSLDLSNWDTSKVTDMGHMFYYCPELTSLDLSNWDTSKVTDMSWMFHSCRSLTELRMGGNPSKVTEVSGMFGNISTNGTFYYNSSYDYSKILAELPSTWTAVPCTMVDGVLVPNN